MAEIRVTVDEKLHLIIEEIVDAGLYPSKAELMRCGLVRLLKDLGLVSIILNENRAAKKSR